jgi:RimJ/RimL family protein N-acetyltransferase
MRTEVRVELVPLAGEHADLIWRWAQDEDLRRVTGSWPIVPERSQVAEAVIRWARDPMVRSYIICADGVAVGNCWLGHIDGVSATLGIAIAEPDARGRGAGTQALRLLLAHAADLDRVTLWAFVANEGALAVYRKLGFQETGRGVRDGREIIEMVKSMTPRSE